MNKVKIYGGLGNQIFQYAFCLALNSKGHKTRISFSNYLYEKHHYGFSLNKAFDIHLYFPWNFLDFFLSKYSVIYSNKYIRHVLKVIIEFYHKKWFKAYHESEEFVYDPDAFNQHSRYFIGIWQVEEYFKDIEEVIKKRLIFRKPVDYKNMQLIGEITNCNSVSIHIRRGDFFKKQWVSSHAVINDITYYKNSIDYISERINNPFFFIFSDDINWVKANLEFEKCIYIENNKGKDAYIDMYLMSLCKHNIIANSTFSWWAAWLNLNRDKIITIPERWLNTKQCEGIYPKEWKRIKVVDN